MLSFPDPSNFGRDQPLTLISLFGENYPKSVKKVFGDIKYKYIIAGNRYFTNKEDYAEYKVFGKENKLNSQYILLKTFVPFVLTKDPANLSNDEYQNAVIKKVFDEMSGVKDVEETKDAENKNIEEATLESVNLDKNNYDDIPPLLETRANQPFETFSKFKRSDCKHFALNIISYNHKGEELEEPIIISLGFFEDKVEVEKYIKQRTFFLKRKYPKHFISQLDIVCSKVDTPCPVIYKREINDENIEDVADLLPTRSTVEDILANPVTSIQAVDDEPAPLI